MNLFETLCAMGDNQHHSTLVGNHLMFVDLIGQGGVRHQQYWCLPRRVYPTDTDPRVTRRRRWELKLK